MAAPHPVTAAETIQGTVVISGQGSAKASWKEAAIEEDSIVTIEDDDVAAPGHYIVEEAEEGEPTEEEDSEEEEDETSHTEFKVRRGLKVTPAEKRKIARRMAMRALELHHKYFVSSVGECVHPLEIMTYDEWEEFLL